MKEVKEYKTKEHYNDIQIIEVERYNKEIKELNRLYEYLHSLDEKNGTMINEFNRLIKIQKEHLKKNKPSWLKR